MRLTGTMLGLLIALLFGVLIVTPAASALPEDRQWEMVSPPKKGGPWGPQSYIGAAIQASEDGNAFTEGAETSGPTGEAEGNRSIEVTQFLSARSSSGWSTQDIVTPHNAAEGIVPEKGNHEYRLFSPDLSLAIVAPEVQQAYPLENPPLAPPSQTGEPAEKTVYLRANKPIVPGQAEQTSYEQAAANSGYLAPGYLPLVTKLNATANEPFGSNLEAFVDATPDLSHVIVRAEVPLTPGAPREGLYEWSSTNHALELVSMDASGAPTKGATLGTYPNVELTGSSRNAISRDGSRVIFTSAFQEKEEGEENAAAFLFMREPGTSKTIQINAAQGEAKEPKEKQRANEVIDRTRYQTASTDGSKIFFTDTWALTTESHAKPTENKHPADLYEFDASTGKLTDLTVPANTKEKSGGVLGVIPGASEDGRYVYFVANAVLASGGSPPEKVGPCSESTEEGSPPGARCNLYVSEPDASEATGRRTRFIARVSAEDGADWGVPDPNSTVKPWENELTYVTARVSPGSGEYLAFMSEESLTGFDNVDSNAEAEGARDEEVFLYNAKSSSLACVSCSPGGEQPSGVLDGQVSGEGPLEGLLVDQPQAWSKHWLAASIPGWTALTHLRAIYQSRYLDEDGRLFFNSPEALVPEDKNGKMDVYEYVPDGVGSCTEASGCVSLLSSGAEGAEHESAFLDASANGSDVFFLTSQPLDPSRDTDNAYDVYDARVCGTGESGPCVPALPSAAGECAEEGCRPAISAQQAALQAGGTATASGSANTAAQGVLPHKEESKPKPKPLTKAQRLAKALKSCRRKYKGSSKSKKNKRKACEKRARKTYGAKKSSKKKAKKSVSNGGRR